MSSSNSSWEAYLEECERNVAQIENALDVIGTAGASQVGEQGGREVTLSDELEALLERAAAGSAPEIDLGPLPELLASRVRALVVTQSELADRVRSVQSEIRSHISVVRSSTRRPQDTPVYLDVQG